MRICKADDNYLQKLGHDGSGDTQMNKSEETKLLEQIEQWNKADEFSRCIEAI